MPRQRIFSRTTAVENFPLADDRVGNARYRKSPATLDMPPKETPYA